jgi:DNA-binding XRE family transcriptional regulator
MHPGDIHGSRLDGSLRAQPTLDACWRQPWLDGHILRTMPRNRRPSADAIRFGWILKRLRQQRGWTLVQLASYFGMNRTYLGVLETGGNMLSLETLLKLADLFGADAAEIVREVEEARRTEKRLRTAAPAVDAEKA